MCKRECENNYSQLDCICEASFKNVVSEDFQYILCDFYNVICGIVHHIIVGNDIVSLDYCQNDKDELKRLCPIFGFGMEDEQKYCYYPYGWDDASTKVVIKESVIESFPLPRNKGVLIGNKQNYKKCFNSIEESELKKSILVYSETLLSSVAQTNSNNLCEVQSNLDFFLGFTDENLKHFSKDSIYYNFLIFCEIFNCNNSFSKLSIGSNVDCSILKTSIKEVKCIIKGVINKLHKEQNENLKSLIDLLEYQEIKNLYSKSFIHCLIMSLHNEKVITYKRISELLTESSNVSFGETC